MSTPEYRSAREVYQEAMAVAQAKNPGLPLTPQNFYTAWAAMQGNRVAEQKKRLAINALLTAQGMDKEAIAKLGINQFSGPQLDAALQKLLGQDIKSNSQIYSVVNREAQGLPNNETISFSYLKGALPPDARKLLNWKADFQLPLSSSTQERILFANPYGPVNTGGNNEWGPRTLSTAEKKVGMQVLGGSYLLNKALGQLGDRARLQERADSRLSRNALTGEQNPRSTQQIAFPIGTSVDRLPMEPFYAPADLNKALQFNPGQTYNVYGKPTVLSEQYFPVATNAAGVAVPFGDPNDWIPAMRPQSMRMSEIARIAENEGLVPVAENEALDSPVGKRGKKKDEAGTGMTMWHRRGGATGLDTFHSGFFTSPKDGKSYIFPVYAIEGTRWGGPGGLKAQVENLPENVIGQDRWAADRSFGRLNYLAQIGASEPVQDTLLDYGMNYSHPGHVLYQGSDVVGALNDLAAGDIRSYEKDVVALDEGGTRLMDTSNAGAGYAGRVLSPMEELQDEFFALKEQARKQGIKQADFLNDPTVRRIMPGGDRYEQAAAQSFGMSNAPQRVGNWLDRIREGLEGQGYSTRKESVGNYIASRMYKRGGLDAALAYSNAKQLKRDAKNEVNIFGEPNPVTLPGLGEGPYGVPGGMPAAVQGDAIARLGAVLEGAMLPDMRDRAIAALREEEANPVAFDENDPEELDFLRRYQAQPLLKPTAPAEFQTWFPGQTPIQAEAVRPASPGYASETFVPIGGESLTGPIPYWTGNQGSQKTKRDWSAPTQIVVRGAPGPANEIVAEGERRLASQQWNRTNALRNRMSWQGIDYSTESRPSDAANFITRVRSMGGVLPAITAAPVTRGPGAITGPDRLTLAAAPFGAPYYEAARSHGLNTTTVALPVNAPYTGLLDQRDRSGMLTHRQHVRNTAPITQPTAPYILHDASMATPEAPAISPPLTQLTARSFVTPEGIEAINAQVDAALGFEDETPTPVGGMTRNQVTRGIGMDEIAQVLAEEEAAQRSRANWIYRAGRGQTKRFR